MRPIVSRTAAVLLLIFMLFVSIISSIQEPPKPPHQTYRTDIFIPGTKANPKWYYAPAGEDFMAKWGLLPGDTIAIKVGPSGENYFNNIDIHLAPLQGITLMPDFNNKVQIEIGWIGLGGKCKDFKLLGFNKYVTYGFKFFDPLHFGLSWSCVGDIEANYIEVDGCNMGVQLLTTDFETYAANYQRANFHNLLIRNVSDEAMYLGWKAKSPIQMELNIHDIVIRNAGKDGIQTRNTLSTIIKNCDLDSIGMRSVWGDDHGILLGNNPQGAVVEGNKLRNIDGIGIWNDGFGTFTYKCNDIQAKGEALFSRPYNPDRPSDWGDYDNIGLQNITAQDNILTSDKGVAGWWLYKPEANKVVEFTAFNNKTSGQWDIATGVTFTQANNNLFVVPACGGMVVLPLPDDEPKPPPPQPQKKYLRVDFYDSNGWTVMTRKNLSEKEAEAILKNSRLASGMYYVQFADREAFTKKIIKQ